MATPATLEQVQKQAEQKRTDQAKKEQWEKDNTKTIDGVLCRVLHPAKATGHGKSQKRHTLWLNPDDVKKVRRGIFEAVVIDQATGKAYHIEGKSCGLHDNEERTLGCFCDALAWPLAVTQYRKFLMDALAEETVFVQDLKVAVIRQDYDDLYVVECPDGSEIWEGSDTEGYKTKADAEKELARVREDVAGRVLKAKAAAAVN